MLLYFAIAVLLVQAASCKPLVADKKCVPMQWESMVIGTSATVVNGIGKVYVLNARVSADYEKGVQVLTEDVFSEGKYIGTYEVLYTEKSTYIIDLVMKKCGLYPGIKPVQICSDDPQLNLVSSYTLGEQMTDTYQAMGDAGVSYVTVTRDTFTPISEVTEIYGTSDKAGVLDSVHYGNVTQGIRDPSVFDVPVYCNSAKFQKGNSQLSGSMLFWLDTTNQ